MRALARRERQLLPGAPDATIPAAIPAAPATANRAAPNATARVVSLEPGLYAFSLAAGTDLAASATGFPLPAVHVCAPAHSGGLVEIIDPSGGPGAWLGGRHTMLFVKTSAGGGAALVTAYSTGDPDRVWLALDIRRIDPARQALAAPLAPGPGSTAAAQQRGELEVVAHIRGRGDVRFADAPWIGRLGPGLWIEEFTLLPRDPSAAAAIEYKGLVASGAETPWIGSGSPCGTRGQSLPLIGFAMRQKAGQGGALFDCEYAGYFQSGVTAGPVRNGAPCRSPTNADPLEGLQLRITPRANRAVPAKPE
ncbi:MAG TPA: hypothetical protein VNF04_04420 [Stellaceae bacterium]|nr:hypothetical protein [Stellaceae bacterium]